MKHVEAKIFWETTNGHPILRSYYPTINALRGRSEVQITAVRDEIVGVRATAKGTAAYERFVKRELRKHQQTRAQASRLQGYLAAAIF